MINISDLNELYSAVQTLESMIERLESLNSKTNNAIYEETKYARVTVKRAKEAYEKIKNSTYVS